MPEVRLHAFYHDEYRAAHAWADEAQENMPALRQESGHV